MNSNIIIYQTINSIKIRKINDREHFNFDYVNLNIYLKKKFKKKSLIVYIKIYIYIINNLRIKILININIICSKKITTNLQTRKLIIKNCKMIIFIIFISINFQINCIIKFYHIIIISTYSIIIILFKTQNFKLSKEKKYFFQLHVILFDFKIKSNIITYIINVKTFVIHGWNIINKLIIVFKHIVTN